MKRKRFTEEQIIGFLNEPEQAGIIREGCRLNNITEQTFSAGGQQLAGLVVRKRID